MIIYLVKKARIKRNTREKQKAKKAFGSSVQIFLIFPTVNDC
jgi:hypothetical protein